MREPELCWGCWWMEVCTSRGGREKIQASKGFCGSKVSKERTESTEGSRDTSRGSRNSGWVRDSERNAISKKHLGCRKGSPSQAVWRMRFSYYLPFPLLAPVLAWLTQSQGLLFANTHILLLKVTSSHPLLPCELYSTSLRPRPKFFSTGWLHHWPLSLGYPSRLCTHLESKYITRTYFRHPSWPIW